MEEIDWQNVTPPSLPEGLVNCIEVSPHKPGTAYVAYTRYKFNDFTPHVLITNDFGQNWSDRAQGIEGEAHVRVVREDPMRPGLLYAGTETGLFLSYDSGTALGSVSVKFTYRTNHRSEGASK